MNTSLLIKVCNIFTAGTPRLVRDSEDCHERFWDVFQDVIQNPVDLHWLLGQLGVSLLELESIYTTYHRLRRHCQFAVGPAGWSGDDFAGLRDDVLKSTWCSKAARHELQHEFQRRFRGLKDKCSVRNRFLAEWEACLSELVYVSALRNAPVKLGALQRLQCFGRACACVCSSPPLFVALTVLGGCICAAGAAYAIPKGNELYGCLGFVVIAAFALGGSSARK